MAAQVLSGNGNVSYTNSTGQNVRVVINWLKNDNTSDMTLPGSVSFTLEQQMVFGKSLGYKSERTSSGGDAMNSFGATRTAAGAPQWAYMPLEFAMANGDTFNITGRGHTNIQYNIIIIPEAG